MKQIERKMERFRAGTEKMGAAERAALKAAMEAASAITMRWDRERMSDAVTEIGAAAGRDVRKAASDKRTDNARRKLVGARLPLADVERCRSCANAQGVSLYRFVAEALERACDTYRPCHEYPRDYFRGAGRPGKPPGFPGNDSHKHGMSHDIPVPYRLVSCGA